ncbi:Metallo-hydrolase/oxidoreductase [Zopfochytrium polystomum]|nr:Metallo-hydrolase/oxidoreductase [Zopfochytrium polystomum]
MGRNFQSRGKQPNKKSNLPAAQAAAKQPAPPPPTATHANGDGTTTHCFFHAATGSWTFLVVDDASGAAALVDPVLDYDLATHTASAEFLDGAVLPWIRAQNGAVQVQRILETHAHADHLSGAQLVKARLAAPVPVCIGKGIAQVQETVKRIYSLDDEFDTTGALFDVLLADGDTFRLGSTLCTVLHTPGHTPDSNTFRIGRHLYVGDTLFPPDAGSARVDFPGGSAAALHASIAAILAHPPDTRVYSGHDYPPPAGPASNSGSDGGLRRAPIPFATVAAQWRDNIHVRGGLPLEAFARMRGERDRTLGAPRLMHPALQTNAAAGWVPRFVKMPVRLRRAAAAAGGGDLPVVRMVTRKGN